ncbi:MAG: Ig-like domain-containing protein [Clostridiales bacterium]|jgi:hypothetical protein|nr:Ig-like domain-containing protein [Clostridiales bacterium]
MLKTVKKPILAIALAAALLSGVFALALTPGKKAGADGAGEPEILFNMFHGPGQGIGGFFVEGGSMTVHEKEVEITAAGGELKLQNRRVSAVSAIEGFPYLVLRMKAVTSGNATSVFWEPGNISAGFTGYGAYYTGRSGNTDGKWKYIVIQPSWTGSFGALRIDIGGAAPTAGDKFFIDFIAICNEAQKNDVTSGKWNDDPTERGEAFERRLFGFKDGLQNWTAPYQISERALDTDGNAKFTVTGHDSQLHYEFPAASRPSVYEFDFVYLRIFTPVAAKAGIYWADEEAVEFEAGRSKTDTDLAANAWTAVKFPLDYFREQVGNVKGFYRKLRINPFIVPESGFDAIPAENRWFKIEYVALAGNGGNGWGNGGPDGFILNEAVGADDEAKAGQLESIVDTAFADGTMFNGIYVDVTAAQKGAYAPVADRAVTVNMSEGAIKVDNRFDPSVAAQATQADADEIGGTAFLPIKINNRNADVPAALAAGDTAAVYLAAQGRITVMDAKAGGDAYAMIPYAKKAGGTWERFDGFDARYLTAWYDAAAGEYLVAKGTLAIRTLAGSIAPSKTSIIAKLGTNETVTVAFDNEFVTNKVLLWESSDDTIVGITGNGQLNFLSAGNATVTVKTTDGTNLEREIGVSVRPLISGITLNKTALTAEAGSEAQKLTATISPSVVFDSTLTWASDNEAVCTVSADGTLAFVAEGTATVTVSANDGTGKSESCTVTVTAAPDGNGGESGGNGCKGCKGTAAALSAAFALLGAALLFRKKSI